MKKFRKALIVSLIITIGLSIMKIAGNHRSNPADIITYETNNPFITGRTELIAHRFGAGIAPEESKLAIDTCLSRDDISMDIYEFDLRMTKDGYAVVFHDKTLDEITDAVAVGVLIGIYEDLVPVVGVAQLTGGLGGAAAGGEKAA